VGDYCEDKLHEVKGQYTDLAERDPGEHWYDNIKLASSISKKGKKAQSSQFDALALEHYKAYLAEENIVENVVEKREKAAYYVNGLLRNGGPSTDVFKKSLGEKTTEKLFRNVLFGI
jgi:hypothetical protein